MELEQLKRTKSIVVQPDLASTDEVWSFIDRIIKEEKISRKKASNLKLCTDEIYSNILRYSHATKVEIQYDHRDAQVMLIFRDNGIPYDPTGEHIDGQKEIVDEEEIGCLGIYMVKNTADSMSYIYEENQNILVLTFELQ